MKCCNNSHQIVNPNQRKQNKIYNKKTILIKKNTKKLYNNVNNLINKSKIMSKKLNFTLKKLKNLKNLKKQINKN